MARVNGHRAPCPGMEHDKGCDLHVKNRCKKKIKKRFTRQSPFMFSKITKFQSDTKKPFSKWHAGSIIIDEVWEFKSISST